MSWKAILKGNIISEIKHADAVGKKDMTHKKMNDIKQTANPPFLVRRASHL